MTTPAPRRHLLAVSALAATLLVGSATGAVAGSMITGKQIQDHSIQTKDLSRATVQSLSAVQGYQRVRKDISVEPNEQGFGSVSCPAGKRVLGGAAYFASTFESRPFIIAADGRSAKSDGVNTYDITQNLRLDLVCATVGSAKALPN